jgi:ParB family chromosome partitioning protein
VRRDPAASRLEDELRAYLQTDVRIDVAGNDRGTLRIQFYSAEDLERLLELIMGSARREF